MVDIAPNQETGRENGKIQIDSLRRGQLVLFNLISPDSGVSEQAHLHIVSPGRRLLYEADSSLRTPPRAELRRDTSDAASRILLQTEAYTTMPGSTERIHSLVAVPDEPGAARRRDHYSVTQANSLVIPYTEPSMDAPPRPELVENKTFQHLQTFFNTQTEAARSQRIMAVWLADGEHAAFVQNDSEVDIGNRVNTQQYRIRRVMGDALGETHYTVQKTEVQEVEGSRVVVRTSTVVSNNPEYHGTQYIDFSDVLNTTDDPNRGHDCVVEITPFGDSQVIARRASEQRMADEGELNTTEGTYSVAGKSFILSRFTPEDVSTMLNGIESPAKQMSNATPVKPNLFQRFFGKKS